MATVRIIVTLKQGVLDAQGQAVRQGLGALGYGGVHDVKVGRYIELTVPDTYPADEIHQMCDRLLANPLIEEWRLETGNGETRKRGNAERRGSEARGLH
jgi:phosphoribosylformylglycinamidine synthase PurS subunit